MTVHVTSPPIRISALAALLTLAPLTALHAAPGDDDKAKPTLRPGAIPRSNITRDPPVAQHRTLEVEQFSGDFARWTDRMTITERRRLRFRWKNLRGAIASPRWQVVRSANAPLTMRGGHLAEGAVPRIPAKGSTTAFYIDLKQVLPATPPAAPRKYYIRIVVSERTRTYVDSRPVVITYERPSSKITQFTDEGLQTTPPKKVAPPGDRAYHTPKIGGIAIDWCKHWGTQCGQPAADEFCRQEGYRRAKYWAKNNHSTNTDVCPNNVCKTRIIMNYSQVCEGKHCRGLVLITCTHDRDCETKSIVLDSKRDHCGWDSKILIAGKEGNVEVPWVPKQTNSVHSIPVTPKFLWYCSSKGVLNENLAWRAFTCPKGTTHVDVSRWTTKYKEQKDVEFTCRKHYQVCKD